MAANVVIRHATDAAQGAAGAAADVAAALDSALKTRGQALFAVSGGRSPLGLYAALRVQVRAWPTVTVIQVDERCVPPDHADSNAALVSQHLLRDAAATARWVPFFDALPAAASQPDAGARLAQAASARLAPLAWPIDVAVLGMGEDGHTASLFPAADGLADARVSAQPVAWVRPAHAPHLRLTLTLPTLMAARCLVLLVAGPAKQRVFEAACVAPRDDLPVSWLLHQSARPVHVWLSDS
ncbi:MAG: 6-phosphogluconolactonase [Burkholderiaceae bacterium]|jgi:6-phosphogluconolactonase|nr:6-phosphogluconolactonase [Burkholderiaceae bacterium]